MSIFIKVENQRLIPPINLGRLVAGSQEFVKFKFGLDSEWDGLITFAQFKQETSLGSGSYEAYNKLLDTDNCACLPAEITTGICTLTLYGSDGTTRATVNYLELRIDDNNLVVDAQSTDISQSLYDQFVADASLVFAARDATIAARDRANTAANIANTSASNAETSAINAANSAAIAESYKRETEEALATVNGQIAVNAAGEATASALQAEASAATATSLAMVDDLDSDRLYTKQFVIQDGHFGIRLTEIIS